MSKKEELIQLAKENTLVFVGPTAAGKDTVMRSISCLTEVPTLISHTTRPMRPGEVDGVEYYFTDNEEFESIPMIESRAYDTADADYTWYYGLSEGVGSKHGLLILDWQGFKDFKDWRVSKGLKAPLAVFVKIDKEESRKRQVNRGDYYEPEFERRWESDLVWIKDAEKESDWVWDEEWLENGDAVS